MRQKSTVLIVDDENGVRQSFYVVLKDEYQVLLAANGEEALQIFSQKNVDLVLLDILLPDINGLDLLAKIKEMDTHFEVIMITAVKEIQTAVKAIKLGAYDYIVKPFDVDEVLEVIRRALEKRELLKEVVYLREELGRHHLFEKMVGKSAKMKEIFDLISTLAQAEGTVLIQGESGTGKELVARAIHNLSPRKKFPFVVINCAAIPPTLMESEIFGYQKGAFTGALNTVMGKLEIAQKGTVFLDDIDSLNIPMQGKLLRVIQEKEFERVGSTKVIKLDLRFIVASNKDLLHMIGEGNFREDLYFRLNVFPLTLPPLRDRKEDLPLLLDHFLERETKKSGKPPIQFSPEAMDVLNQYDWPGNVRELENLLERLTAISKNPVIHFPDLSFLNLHRKEIRGMQLKDAVDTFEREYIMEVLECVNGNKTKAAEKLGIHRNTLLNKLNELNLKI
jgi:DNA-binding NtrC family response regulator